MRNNGENPFSAKRWVEARKTGEWLNTEDTRVVSLLENISKGLPLQGIQQSKELNFKESDTGDEKQRLGTVWIEPFSWLDKRLPNATILFFQGVRVGLKTNQNIIKMHAGHDLESLSPSLLRKKKQKQREGKRWDDFTRFEGKQLQWSFPSWKLEKVLVTCNGAYLTSRGKWIWQNETWNQIFIFFPFTP